MLSRKEITYQVTPFACTQTYHVLLAHFSPYAVWMNVILDVDVIQPSGLLFP